MVKSIICMWVNPPVGHIGCGDEMSDDNEIIKELRELTKNKNVWKSNIDDVAAKLDENYSVNVRAKALWLLGEMGLRYPMEIQRHVGDIADYLENDDSKLRQRSANALGRIGRADKNLVAPYMDRLMDLRDDESGDVRHAFIWASENIALNAPELFCGRLDLYWQMIFDSYDKVRIEAPEMFRVIGKTNPDCVMPYLEKLEFIAENDEHPVVRIHSAGAVRIARRAMNEK